MWKFETIPEGARVTWIFETQPKGLFNKVLMPFIKGRLEAALRSELHSYAKYVEAKQDGARP